MTRRPYAWFDERSRFSDLLSGGGGIWRRGFENVFVADDVESLASTTPLPIGRFAIGIYSSFQSS